MTEETKTENARTAKKNTSCLDEFDFDTQYFTVCMQLNEEDEVVGEYRHCATISPSSIFSVFDEQQYVDSYYSVICPRAQFTTRNRIDKHVCRIAVDQFNGPCLCYVITSYSVVSFLSILLTFRRSLFILLGKRRGTDRYALQTFLYALKDATRFFFSFLYFMYVFDSVVCNVA